jgi:hypothetical protein
LERKERRKRVRWFLQSVVVRPALLVAWCFVLWGTLLLVLVAIKTLQIGLGGALRAALGGEPGLYAWANASSIVLALVVWPTVLWMRRLSGRAPETRGTGGDA